MTRAEPCPYCKCTCSLQVVRGKFRVLCDAGAICHAEYIGPAGESGIVAIRRHNQLVEAMHLLKDALTRLKRLGHEIDTRKRPRGPIDISLDVFRSEVRTCGIKHDDCGEFRESMLVFLPNGNIQADQWLMRAVELGLARGDENPYEAMVRLMSGRNTRRLNGQELELMRSAKKEKKP